MATFTARGPLGRDPFAPPSTTPGPLGHNEPDSGTHTPGPVGFNDPHDPAVKLKQEHASLAQQQPRITVVSLSLLFPGASKDYLRKVVKDLEVDVARYQLESRLRLAHFFAQVREETGEALKAQDEDLNYRPEALKRTFRYYRDHDEEAQQDGYHKDPITKKLVAADQQRIANVAYAGRNGNRGIESGDGWRYRGRGFIQVTGRGNYAAISRQYKIIYGGSVNFESKPELIQQFPYNLRSAVCYWNLHKLFLLADGGAGADNVDRITSVINRFTNSYENRRRHFKKAYEAFI